MQGIYRGSVMALGDVPLTASLDLAMNGEGVSSLTLAHRMIIMSGYAEIRRE